MAKSKLTEEAAGRQMADLLKVVAEFKVKLHSRTTGGIISAGDPTPSSGGGIRLAAGGGETLANNQQQPEKFQQGLANTESAAASQRGR